MTQEENQDGKIKNPHDKVFRDFFSHREVAMSFLEEYLPEHILSHLELNTLKISKDTFVDKQLADFSSDLLYELQYETQNLFVYILFEHKSYVDPLTSYQLLKYMVRIWELYLKQNKGVKSLPIVLPLVVYHGDTQWNVGNRFSSLFQVPPSLKEHMPDFCFRLYDFSHMSDAELKGHVLLKAILMTFKYIRSPELIHRLDDIIGFFNHIDHRTKGIECLHSLMKYMFGTTENITFEDVKGSINRSLKEGGRVMPTIEQQMKQKMRAEMEAEVRAQVEAELKAEGGAEANKITAARMLKLGLSIDIVSQSTGLPKKEILLIKKTNTTTH